MNLGSTDTWDRIGNALGPAAVALATFVGAEIVRRLNDARQRTGKPLHPVEINNQLDIRIHLELEELRQKLGAMRAFVSRFHNGDRYMDESDIVRKSRTHEVVRPGVSYEAERVKSLLISTVPEEMALVIVDGPAYTLVRDLRHGKFRWICEQSGVKSTARCAVRRGRDIVGFVGVDFDTETEQPPAGIESLCETAFTVGQIIHRAADR